MGYKVHVASSNKHLHLQQDHLDILFGKGYELTFKKPLVQPGQFAAEETVEIIGPKKTMKLRVLGPVRPETQIELAMTDARSLGVSAPIKESGHLDGTPGCKIVGPCGEVEIDHGIMIAQRHLHLNDEQGAEAGVKDHDVVKIRIEGERALVFDNVIARVGVKHEREVHLDTDESNAAGVGSDTECEIVEINGK